MSKRTHPPIAVYFSGKGGIERQLGVEATAVFWAAKAKDSFSAAVDDLLSDGRFAAAAVFDRFKEVLGLETDAELAWILGISRQSLWNRKNKNSPPYREAIFIADMANVSLEYLLTGRNDSGDHDDNA